MDTPRQVAGYDLRGQFSREMLYKETTLHFPNTDPHKTHGSK